MPEKKQTRKIRKPMVASQIRGMRRDELPASVGLVKAVRSEILAETRSVEKRLESKIGALDSKIGLLDSKIGLLDSKIGAVTASVEQVLSNVHGIRALVEEQRSENRIVLDGLKSVIDRQDRAEVEAKEFRVTFTVFLNARNV